jgi:TonB family protein
MTRASALIAAIILALSLLAGADTHRDIKSKVQPNYPELARQMHLAGTVKLEVVVAPNGSVRKATVLGGNPVLASSALQAVQQWRFEPAQAETTELVEIHFNSSN